MPTGYYPATIQISFLEPVDKLAKFALIRNLFKLIKKRKKSVSCRSKVEVKYMYVEGIVNV